MEALVSTLANTLPNILSIVLPCLTLAFAGGLGLTVAGVRRARQRREYREWYRANLSSQRHPNQM